MFTKKVVLAILGTLLFITIFAVFQYRKTLQTKELPPKLPPVATIQQNTTPKTEEQSDLANLSGFLISEQGLFKIEIPEKQKEKPQIINQNINNSQTGAIIPYTIYSYNGENNNSYHISFISYPREVFENKSEEELLLNLRDGQINDYKGTIKRETDSYNIGGIARKEIEIQSQKANKILYIRSNLIVSEPYVFVISYISPIQIDLYSDFAEKFFTSFRLYKQDMPMAVISSTN